MTTIAPTSSASLAQGALFDMDRASIFLDLDGTLAPLADAPGEVGPDPLRTQILTQLADRLEGRAAILSGRTIEEVDRIAGGVIAPVAGVHGLQRRTASGDINAIEAHPRLDEAAEQFRIYAGVAKGLLVEHKGVSVALHYRGSPGSGDAVRELGQRLERTMGLTLQEGHMVVELRTPGPNKGDALAAFMAEPPFAGSRPVYIGDDLTDEDGFAAAAAAGGYGILVGAPRPTRAAWRLDGVDDVYAWLSAGLARATDLGGQRR